jgi:parallel beta-helix repeat protein
MKKITLLLVLVCSMSMFATRYLVQTGAPGAATWRAAGAGEVLVDLTVNGQSLNAWYNGLSSSVGDEVWVIEGTYVTTGVTTIKNGVSLYGGFAGTENTMTERIKTSGGNAWNFENVTIIDGNNTNKGFSSANLANETYIDGFTITKCKATVGAGAEIGVKTIINNCIVNYSEATGTSNDGGGGIRVKGGVVSNSHIHNNTTATGGGAGIGSQSTSLIEDCLIENNTVTGSGKGGGGIYVATSGGTVINNCTLKNNTAAGTGGGINVYFGSLQTGGVTVNNTKFIENKALGTVGGGINANANTTTPITINGCTFNGNTSLTYGGGVQVQTGNLVIRKSVFVNNIAGTSSLNAGSAVYGQLAFELSNSLIVNNTGSSTIYVKASNTKLYNNTIAQNSGSVAFFPNADTSGDINNCIMTGNSSIFGFHSSSTIYPLIVNSSFSGDISGMTYLGSGCFGDVISEDTYILPTNFQGASTNSTDSLAIVNANWELKYNASSLNAGATISSILEDLSGISRPQGSAYDIGAYELPYFNTTVTFNAGGTVNALTSGDMLSEPKGKPLTFTITPSGGQQVASVKYNNVEVKEELVDGVYTAPALAANATLVVEFSATTSVTEINSDLVCFANGNSIEIRGMKAGEEINVYSITGAALFTQKAVNNSMSVPVARGIYIVKAANQVKKVVVD